MPITYLGNEGPLTLITGDQKREIALPESDRYRLQAEDFTEAILLKRPPRLAPEETMSNMELID